MYKDSQESVPTELFELTPLKRLQTLEILKMGYTYDQIREIYKMYKDSQGSVPTGLLEMTPLKRLQTLLNKCKPGIFKKRDRNCTYTQTQSRRGGKFLNKRSRRRK
jgi:hypothetical protein